MRVLLPLLVLAYVSSACVPLARDAACVAADNCDKALDEPFGSFDVTDDQFGDAAADPNVGTCWFSADTAAPCIQTCNAFVAEERQRALEQNRLDIFEACGGDLDEDEDEEDDEA